MPAKSSPMDKIPTSIIKSCVDVFAPVITRLATLSFREGSFPSIYKIASVSPLIKKKDADRDNPANYRPISNLHTISKILERIFLSRIIHHIEQSPGFNKFQSAYRRGYSTETALLRLLNDVYGAADKKSRSLLVLLDLSAAFDTIDLNTLVHRVERTFGITGTALQWLQSYVNKRSQFVSVGGAKSRIITNEFGIPQGSCLGPCLFALYVAPIAGVIESFGVSHAQYADDTQLYVALNSATTLTTMNNCFEAVHHWFAVNGLALNPGKSEATVIGTSAKLRIESKIDTIALSDVRIPVADCVKSLGVSIDSTLSFNQHVDNICKASHYHIRALRHIRQCLNNDTARTVASSMVGARLDYCNSLLYGTTTVNINKLQRVQNSLARVVTGTRRYDHITAVLADLHWLKIQERITYKIALLTFKTVTTNRPTYLADLVSFHAPVRALRSNQQNRLHCDRVRTQFGSRAFSHAAPSVWNSLPLNLTDTSVSLATFKRHLKTYLYEQSFRR